jgi:5-methylcytosine-specific restriction endonuclease McrA
MPIRPENKDRYPDDWPEISNRIRFERAGGRCECDGECGINHGGRCEARHGEPHPITESIVVLTTAHLDDPDPENCADENLKAMCQRCHLNFDAAIHKANAMRTRTAKLREGSVGDLFEEMPDV